MAVADIALGRFDIGRAFTRTFEVIRANFVPFFALGIVATIPTTIYVFLTTSGLLPDATSIAQGRAVGLFFVAAMISAIIGAFCGLVLQAALTYGAISYLSGQPVSLGRAVGVGLSQFFPLIGIGILEAFGLMGGALLLLFPAIMLLVMWSMVVPARVAEHTGILASFSRSRELTAGYRWPIFGTLVVLWLGSGIAQTAIRPMVAAGTVSTTAYVGALLTALVTAIVAVASATLHASIYYELRMIKEGAGPAQIAAIFD
jgi:hypothetical protein